MTLPRQYIAVIRVIMSVHDGFVGVYVFFKAGKDTPSATQVDDNLFLVVRIVCKELADHDINGTQT